jgi:phage tail P2-like protein
MKTIENVKLKDTLPNSIKDDANISAMSEAIDKQLQSIAKDVDKPTIYANLERLPSVALDHLAFQFNVSPWRDYWDKSLKVSVIITAIANKRIRGTRHAVKKCLESFGGLASIVEWHEQTPPGEPGTFDIAVVMSDKGLTEADIQEDVHRMIKETKPASRHYTMTISQAATGGINLCGCVRPVVFTKICNF